MTRRTLRLAAASLLVLLAACGGGGGGDAGGTPIARPTAEGFWVGTNARGAAGALAILPGGALHGFFTDPFGDLLLPGESHVAMSGTMAFAGSAFTGPVQVVTIRPEHLMRLSNDARAEVQPDDSITLAYPDSPDRSSFQGIYRSNYGQPASVEAYAGVYTGRILDEGNNDTSYAGTLTLSRHGVLTHLRGFCTVSGTVRPLGTPRGALAVELAHSDTQRCAVDTEPRTGVVVLDTAVTPPRLYVMTSKPGTGTVQGFRFVGVRESS
jgi:hypothetical protein